MMRKKLLSLLVLLMTAVTGAWAETTIVTWTSSGSYENNNSRGGVTLSGDVVEYIWDELTGGEWRLAYDSNQGTFMTSLGNFTSIVISGGYIHGFSGTGWNGKTWTGNASSVPFRGYLTDANGEEPWTITFTIAPATVAVTGVTLLPTTATLTLGETETVTLTATVLPDEATDKSVTWSSSNTSVATVSNEGVVTAVAAGEATITVTTTDGAKTATCAVTVAAPAAPATKNVTIIFNDLGLDNAYDLTTASLNVGNIKLNFAQNNGLNPPKFYTTNGGTARIYSGNSMSISAGGATITKIVFNLAQGTPTFDTGSYDSTNKTWEGEATTLTLSNEMASGQIRITSMDVYYSVASAAGEATYTVTLREGTDDADKWTITPAEAKTTGVAQGTEITLTYSGTKRVKSVKAEKKSSAPTLKDALADGATVVITYVWFGSNVTTFTYTNNGGTYTGNTTGYDSEYFGNGMSMDGTTLKFSASNIDNPDANVSIDFNTDTNEYVANKGSGFTSFTISVNGTDVTSQLTEVVDETGD